MMNRISYKATETIIRNIEFHYVDVGHKAAVYYMKHSVNTNSSTLLTSSDRKEVVTGGVCTLASAKKVAAGKSAEVDDFKIKGQTSDISSNCMLYGQWAMIPESAMIRFQKEGFWQGLENGDMRSGEHMLNFIETTTEPLTLVLLNFSSHRIFGIDGKYLPLAIPFNYMNGNMGNRNFDLKGVETILLGRTDIQFGLKAKKGSLTTSIPYYNSHCGSEQLEFTFQPSQKDILSIYELMKGEPYDTSDRIHNAIRTLDLLGIEKCRLPERNGDDEEDGDSDD